MIVIDEHRRVLLLRYDEGGGFWATPGGALERGESYAAAALRELHEELGVDMQDVELDAHLAERSQTHSVGGRKVRQVERYFPAFLDPDDIYPDRATQTDSIRELKWWALDELSATRETVYPHGLADLITTFLDSGVPERPVVLR